MDTGTITDILNRTAWRMDTPQLFGSFHIAASLFTAVAAVLAAVFFARRAVIEKNVRRALVFTGWLLLILEVYKQYFLYYIVNEGAFDCWFFPFQLCSMPMYLCMLLPFLKDESRVTLMTFMGGYIFISATHQCHGNSYLSGRHTAALYISYSPRLHLARTAAFHESADYFYRLY